MARILICGAGVIGSVYALRFAKAGFSVSLVARGDRLASLRKAGLIVRQAALGEEEEAEVEVVESPPPREGWDLVIVAVRAGQIPSALESLSRAGLDGPLVVVGNNLGPWEEELATVGAERLVLGFGAFGGYREGDRIVYVDGRVANKPDSKKGAKTTLGILSPAARPALETAKRLFAEASLRVVESGDMVAWLSCHAALVFPLAGAIYAGGGEQAVVCRTRDAIILGIRACKELFRAFHCLGIRTEPKEIGRLLRMPEILLVRVLQKSLAGEGARVAMFGHANAIGGRGEVAEQAVALERLARKAGLEMPNWDRLLPYFPGEGQVPPLPDGSRTIRPRLLFR